MIKLLQTLIAESDETTEESCYFITSDSESDFAVLAIDCSPKIEYSIPSEMETLKKLEVINSALVKVRCIRITLSYDRMFFKATVDTDSPASFDDRRTVE